MPPFNFSAISERVLSEANLRVRLPVRRHIPIFRGIPKLRSVYSRLKNSSKTPVNDLQFSLKDFMDYSKHVLGREPSREAGHRRKMGRRGAQQVQGDASKQQMQVTQAGAAQCSRSGHGGRGAAQCSGIVTAAVWQQRCGSSEQAQVQGNSGLSPVRHQLRREGGRTASAQIQGWRM
ncbi:hypothetical protein K438DRAFT_1771425 [Mycena galopus ATCC 62051]|nr:hypothetical protein K438DRAFT_1771425 [Mycena galopus ATCC 62051]